MSRYDLEMDCEPPAVQARSDIRNVISQSFSLMSSEDGASDSESESNNSPAKAYDDYGEDDNRTIPSVMYDMDWRPHPELKQLCEVPIGQDEEEEVVWEVVSRADEVGPRAVIAPIREDNSAMLGSVSVATKNEISTKNEILRKRNTSSNRKALKEETSLFSYRIVLVCIMVAVFLVTVVLLSLLVIMTRRTSSDRTSLNASIEAPTQAPGSTALATDPPLNFNMSSTSSPEKLENGTSSTASSVQSPSPTTTAVYSFIWNTLIAVSEPDLLLNQTTPQGRAFLKVVDDNESSQGVLTPSGIIQTYAFFALYFSTSRKNWESMSSLVYTLNSVCSWTEIVECGGLSTGEQVIETIKLNDLQLSGSIPNEVCFLDYLTRLDLSSNKLMGTIPECLKDSSSLTKLHLNSNELQGNIPSGILLISTLEELQLSDNNLVGGLDSLVEGIFEGNVIRYGKTWRLRSLSLDNNMLSGEVPTFLGALGQLESLTLHANDLRGQISDTLCERTVTPTDYGVLIQKLTADCFEVSCPCCTVCF